MIMHLAAQNPCAIVTPIKDQDKVRQKINKQIKQNKTTTTKSSITSTQLKNWKQNEIHKEDTLCWPKSQLGFFCNIY